MGRIEWHLGHPDQALRHLEDAVSLARRQNNPFALAYAVSISGQVYGLRGDFKRALEAGDETARLGIELGFPQWNAVGKIVAAWARAQLGQTDGAAERIRNSIADFSAMKFRAVMTLFFALLCEAQACAGAINEALATVDRALQANPEELLYHPYALRLRGELKLRSACDDATPIEVAEQDFRAAIELARRMSAKSDELRVTMSLALLLDKRGRREEGRTMLADVYGWFTEGFDTADLKDAKALLDDLAD
jgi:tetratricopeptide (TPR) repeat protein